MACAVASVRAVAQSDGNRCAVVHAGTPVGLSYRALAVRVARLARRVRAAVAAVAADASGEDETRAGVAVSGGPELVVAQLAVWAAGCAVVPLDVAGMPRTRLIQLLHDSHPAVLVWSVVVFSLPCISRPPHPSLLLSALKVSAGPRGQQTAMPWRC